MLISEWSSDVCSSDLLTLLLADRLQLLTQLASEDELAAHQRGDVQAASLDHVAPGLAQPAQQLALMDVRQIGRAPCREECVSTCRTRCAPDHSRKKHI